METGHKRKRIREKPQKKWTDSECHLILEYIQEKGNFEKPTAQLFYASLLKETKIDATWDIVKWKLRHMKQSFHKAVEWEQSTGAGLLEQEEGLCTVKGKILKICPFYDQLKEIFGEKVTADQIQIYESSTYVEAQLFDEIVEIQDDDFCVEVSQSPPTAEPSTSSKTGMPSTISPATSQRSPPETSPPPSSASASSKKKALQFAEKMKRNAPKSALSQLTVLQSERAEYYDKKMQLENKKFEINSQLEDRKLKLEEQKMEIENRKMKLEEEKAKQEFELRKMEMEKQERIAKHEIEIKYKYTKKNF